MYVNRRRWLLNGAGALGAAAMLAGRNRALAAGPPVVLYNGQHRATTEAVVSAFTQASGIRVTIRQGESAQLANQIIEEGPYSPADVFYSEQSPPMAAVEEKGMLSPVDTATLAQIPAAYASAGGGWIGTCMRCRVVAYNKAMVGEGELPQSIMEFAQPAWKDRVGYVIRDGFQEQIMAIVKLKGEAVALSWLKGIQQYGRLYNANGAAMQAVEQGEIATALVNNYYWYGLAKERGAANMRSALHYVARDDVGALINLSPAAVLKTSKRQQEALQLVAFMVSEAGQRAITATYAEYPVRAGIVSPFDLKPLAEIGGSVTPSDIGTAQLAYTLERAAGIL